MQGKQKLARVMPNKKVLFYTFSEKGDVSV